MATKISPIAKPKGLMFVPDLPKTRSGKIMRRLLRDIAQGRALGDTTTLADAGSSSSSGRSPARRRTEVPFDFLRRKKDAPGAGPTAEGSGGPVIRGVPFDGLTEEWRIVGDMHIATRLSDALNKREAVTISRRALGAGRRLRRAVSRIRPQGDRPYDLILVMAGAATLPPLTDAERTAHKVHKVPFDVALEVPPFRVLGTVSLHPGSEPERLLDRATEMFVPVVGATAYLGERKLADEMDAILVNRFYLRGVEQIDRRTGERAQTSTGRAAGRHELAGPV